MQLHTAFHSLCLLTMIKTVQHYLAGALQNIRNVSKAVMQGMAADIEEIDRFFVNFVDAETVRSGLLYQAWLVQAFLCQCGGPCVIVDATLSAYVACLHVRHRSPSTCSPWSICAPCLPPTAPTPTCWPTRHCCRRAPASALPSWRSSSMPAATWASRKCGRYEGAGKTSSAYVPLQIMEQCREVYIDRQRLLTVEEAARLKPSSKETGFARVLIAARRS